MCCATASRRARFPAGSAAREGPRPGGARRVRNTLRDAFRLLAHDRLVVHELNRGVLVGVLSPADLADLFRVRHAVESAAARTGSRPRSRRGRGRAGSRPPRRTRRPSPPPTSASTSSSPRSRVAAGRRADAPRARRAAARLPRDGRCGCLVAALPVGIAGQASGLCRARCRPVGGEALVVRAQPEGLRRRARPPGAASRAAAWDRPDSRHDGDDHPSSAAIRTAAHAGPTPICLAVVGSARTASTRGPRWRSCCTTAARAGHRRGRGQRRCR